MSLESAKNALYLKRSLEHEISSFVESLSPKQRLLMFIIGRSHKAPMKVLPLAISQGKVRPTFLERASHVVILSHRDMPNPWIIQGVIDMTYAGGVWQKESQIEIYDDILKVHDILPEDYRQDCLDFDDLL